MYIPKGVCSDAINLTECCQEAAKELIRNVKLATVQRSTLCKAMIGQNSQTACNIAMLCLPVLAKGVMFCKATFPRCPMTISFGSETEI